MKKNKSNLDERQEQMLLKIEGNGCWLAFWGLLAAIVVQSVVLDCDIKDMAGESVVLLMLALYIAVGCLKCGIWDRRLKPNTSTNAVVSLTAAAISGILGFIYTVKRFPDAIWGSLAAGIAHAVIAFFGCFVILQLSASLLKKRQDRLEEELPENDEK